MTTHVLCYITQHHGRQSHGKLAHTPGPRSTLPQRPQVKATGEASQRRNSDTPTATSSDGRGNAKSRTHSLECTRFLVTAFPHRCPAPLHLFTDNQPHHGSVYSFPGRQSPALGAGPAWQTVIPPDTQGDWKPEAFGMMRKRGNEKAPPLSKLRNS